MKVNWIALSALAWVAGCSGSTSGGICYSNLPPSISSGYCMASTSEKTTTPVSACPSANVVGTCTFTVGASTPYSFDATYYPNPGFDCSSIKQECMGAASG